jgi:hypothetical protein
MKAETEKFLAARRLAVMEHVASQGLMEGENAPVGARVPKKLVARAKKQSGITSTTELVEYALAKVVLEDDFGRKLVALKGTIPKDIKLDV